MSEQSVSESETIELLIEWPEQYGPAYASISDNLEQLQAESQKAINLAMSAIRSMAYRISRTIEDIRQEPIRTKWRLNSRPSSTWKVERWCRWSPRPPRVGSSISIQLELGLY